jgi:hypothetical protein
MTKNETTKNTEPIIVTVEEKKCGKCLVVKPAKDFWKMRSSKDGLQPQCKNCQLGITEPVKKAEKPVKPAKKAEKPVSVGPTESESADKLVASVTPKPKVSKKQNPIGSGRRRECVNCTMHILSTEGGKCLSEDAEKDPDKNAKGTCKHLVQSKTAKRAAKKAKKNQQG